MQQYVDQLIEDLEKAAAHPPTPAYIEIPPHLESDPVIAEVALVPFKTIQELTGIDEEVFPKVGYLTDEQMEMINAAIFKVFESFNIELIDKPEVIPPDYLYEAITLSWGMFVQYLPSSGYDLELCTQDIETCLYGEFCDYCLDPEYEEDEEIPPGNRIRGSDDELPF
jgi:hypothetical protein